MNTIIIMLIIAYLIISKITGRKEDKLPSRPGRSSGQDIEHASAGDATLRNGDSPLPGPWDTSSRSEDGPLPGPWNNAPRSEDAPLPGPWERKEPVELREPVLDQIQQPVDAAVPREKAGYTGETLTGTLQTPPASRVRRGVDAGHPLTAALRSKSAVLSSMIIGEVLNSRGGRNRRKLGRFW